MSAPQRRYAPASTEKLLTGAAALQVLGPAHVFTTTLATTAPVSGGVLHGDLYLVGGGDPVLATPAYRQRLAANPLTAAEPTTPLDDLAAAVAAAGIHSIDGAIVADDSHDDTIRYSAVVEGRASGESTSVRSARSPSTTASPRAGVAASDPALLDREQPRRAARRPRRRRSPAPPGAAPRPAARAPSRSVTSPRLDAIVASMLTVSDNYTAEMLVRAVGLAVERQREHRGRAARRRSATLRGARRADRGRLARRRLGSVAATTGSPARRCSRPSSSATGRRERALRVGLPIAGRTGTLAARFVGDPLAGPAARQDRTHRRRRRPRRRSSPPRRAP